MHQRDEAEVAQLLLAPVGDGQLGRALERDLALVGLEGMGGQVLHQAAALHAADGGAPAEVFEGAGELAGEGVGRVAPQVFVVVGAVHVLDEIEALGAAAVDRVERHAAQEARQGQAHVARILGLAEGLELGVFDGVEHLGQVARLAQVTVALQSEQFGRSRGDEGRVAGRGHVRHLLEEIHVLGLARHFEVADQCAVGRAAEGAELLLVDLLEDRALVELQGRLEVLDELLLGRVHHADLLAGVGGGILDQVLEPGPAALELLEFGRMHDGRQLLRDHPVQFGHAGVDRGRQIVRHHHRAVHDLADQLGDDVARALVLGAGFGDPALLDDLVEQAGFEGDRGGVGRCEDGGHVISPRRRRPCAGCRACRYC